LFKVFVITAITEMQLRGRLRKAAASIDLRDKGKSVTS